MKALIMLEPQEKARMLAELFPMEIEDVISFVTARITYFREHEQKIRDDWDNGLIAFELWESSLSEAEKAIKKHGGKLVRNPRFFAEQLFSGYRAFFTVDCLVKYVRENGGSKKFQLAVDLLMM